jgi:hypothetical protein
VQEAVQEVQEAVQEAVQEVQEAVEEIGELSKTVVRVVDAVPEKTFLCCLPFLSKFLAKKKQV